MSERMTPTAFKSAYRLKGWTGKSLAARWEVSNAWVSKIANNAERAPHWDDAVRGLPIKKD